MSKKSRGECYKEALEFVLVNEGWILCHGVVTGQGPIKGVRYGHAWCEREGIAHDPSSNVTMGAKQFRSIGKADPVIEYTLDQALAAMKDNQTWGPWETVISSAAHKQRREKSRKKGHSK